MEDQYDALHVALRLIRTLCIRFDNQGESSRSVRAQALSYAMRFLLKDTHGHIESIEIYELLEVIEHLPDESAPYYTRDHNPSSLSELSDFELVCLLIHRQHSLMNFHEGSSMSLMSDATYTLLGVERYVPMLKGSKLLDSENEALLTEAQSRIY